jgi:hypothetical protein
MGFVGEHHTFLSLSCTMSHGIPQSIPWRLPKGKGFGHGSADHASGRGLSAAPDESSAQHTLRRNGGRTNGIDVHMHERIPGETPEEVDSPP